MSSDRLCPDPDEMLAADLAYFVRRATSRLPAIPGTTGLARVFLIECLAQSGLTMRLSMTE